MLRGVFASGALVVAAMAAAPAAGQALDDKYWIEASAYLPSIDTSASVSRPGFPGTVVDVESDLGLKKHKALPAFFGGARFGRFVVMGEYYALDRSGSTTINRDIVFDGSTYPAGVTLESKFQSDVYRATLGYAFLRNERSELGAAIGLHATNFDFATQGQARVGSATLETANRRRSFLAPLPTVGVYGTFEATPKVILNGRVDYLSLKVGDYDGSILNVQASVAYRFNKSFQVGAAYRYVSYGLDVNKATHTARVDYDFSGPSLFLRLGFQ